jgi:nucleolar pre-ribosomal-associated protein 1
MFVLLKQYIITDVSTIRLGLASLMKRQLSETLLFQHQTEEVEIWLSALNFVSYMPLPAASGSTHDTVDSLLVFVDDCIQRCLKTPYRYLDERDQANANSPDRTAEGKTECSPLLFAVLEQFHAKVTGSLLSSSSLLRVTCFIRDVIFNLATVYFDISLFEECARRSAEALNESDSSPAAYDARASAQREIQILVTSLSYMRDGPVDPRPTHDSLLMDYLDQNMASLSGIGAISASSPHPLISYF